MLNDYHLLFYILFNVSMLLILVLSADTIVINLFTVCLNKSGGGGVGGRG